MLFQATRRRKRDGEESREKRGGRREEEKRWHREGMKTALVNGFPFSWTPLLSLLSFLFFLSLFFSLPPPFPSYCASCSAHFCELVFNHSRGSLLVTRVNPGGFGCSRIDRKTSPAIRDTP
ncbi:hypothetical protein PUN28_002630 [Cardiocondyla obscurior]|uniref:Transmembrane protein n=1 Tax=Cardiocondyla obscurior TaxID=286306 RepID=A0AAW2GV87_9HYME